MAKLLILCDWLPPDFGAVGQYTLLCARARAAAGDDVMLAGFSSTGESVERERVGRGSVAVLRLRMETYDRANLRERAIWTAKANLRLVWRIRASLRWADEIVFTGSPPYLVHLLAPLNLLLRKRLTYRIMDFHPECLMATMARTPPLLRALYRLTLFWRRRVTRFEVLGEDQRQRLLEAGIAPERIHLRRSGSPVQFTGRERPLPRPAPLAGKKLVLYSGNWGVAHDVQTFREGFQRHYSQGTGTMGLWLNATGARADRVEHLIRAAALPIHRSRPVPLEQLPRLLVTPDLHLITLRDEFVGYVLPSKVYACIASGKPVLFIGDAASDVHLLCARELPASRYRRVAVGDPAGVAAALDYFAGVEEEGRQLTGS